MTYFLAVEIVRRFLLQKARVSMLEVTSVKILKFDGTLGTA